MFSCPREQDTQTGICSSLLEPGLQSWHHEGKVSSTSEKLALSPGLIGPLNEATP